MSAERSLPSLFALLGDVDAVHGAYYLLMHGWINVFGTSEIATRLPSALAVGFATAGTAVLGRMLVSARVGIIAALVFAVLPRVTYMGAEARSAALATMMAVWSTVLLVRLVRSLSTVRPAAVAWWAGYAALSAAGIYLFLYLVLLVPVHAVVIAVLADRPRVRSLAVWASAATSALVVSAPVLYWGISQREQISFLARRAIVGPVEAAVEQWFGMPVLAVLCWALILIGCLAVFVPRFGAPGSRQAQAVLLTWLLAPSAVLLIGTHLIGPMYALRYLSFCAPAAALLVAVGIAAFRRRWATAVALLLIAALAVPGYLAQRTEFAKDNGSDWRQVADIMHTEARASDAIIFDESTRPSRRPRLAMHLYPAAFVGLVDVTLDQNFQELDELWDTTVPLAAVESRLTGIDRAWVLQNVGSAEAAAGTDVALLHRLGFSTASSQTVNRTIIIELTR
jgi:mannosyltransferase